jgi:hypothetical protein
MPRPYGQKFLIELIAADPTSLGVRLGRLCVDANLPASYVSTALATSRVSVYNWFRGSGIREDKRIAVEAFMALVQKDIEEGILPAKTLSDAKIYIESMLGVEI